VTILLVRHVDAGDRARWPDDDRRRPLTRKGRRQAQLLGPHLAGWTVDRVVSSPYTRCVQTVEPLAASLGLPVETDEALAEGAPLDLVHRLLRRPGGGHVVCCTHGDVLAAVLTDLADRGRLNGVVARWPKGSTWVLDDRLWGTRPTRSSDVEIHYLPPPHVPA
jgi:broad specificity phosphatase PhoE